MRHVVRSPLAFASVSALPTVQALRPAPAAPPRTGVDSTTYDPASVIGIITAKFGLKPLNRRDSEQASIWSAGAALKK